MDYNKFNNNLVRISEQQRQTQTSPNKFKKVIAVIIVVVLVILVGFVLYNTFIKKTKASISQPSESSRRAGREVAPEIFIPETEVRQASPNSLKEYAVLIAGSNEWHNYRHQADVYHAYQILQKEHGILPENIIVFAYDDIANNYQNTFQGKVFNKPDPFGKGEDVYKGVKIDYKGSQVDAFNIINVLKGNKEAMKYIGSGRVLESGENNNVFIYYCGHGTFGTLSLPDGRLFADDLVNTIKYMYKNKKYNMLLIYIEACHSGSLFDTLPANINAYATTASLRHEPSYATYCKSGLYDSTIVNGRSIGTCLSNEYSVSWMTHNEIYYSYETIGDEFEYVLKKTKSSTPKEFGDKEIKNISINNFHKPAKQVSNSVDVKLILNNSAEVKDFEAISETSPETVLDAISEATSETVLEAISESISESISETVSEAEVMSETVSVSESPIEKEDQRDIDSDEVRITYLRDRYETTKLPEDLKKLNDYLDITSKIDEYFKKFDSLLNIIPDMLIESEDSTIEFECLKASMQAYDDNCKVKDGEYILKYVIHINTACRILQKHVVVSAIKIICNNLDFFNLK